MTLKDSLMQKLASSIAVIKGLQATKQFKLKNTVVGPSEKKGPTWQLGPMHHGINTGK